MLSRLTATLSLAFFFVSLAGCGGGGGGGGSSQNPMGSVVILSSSSIASTVSSESSSVLSSIESSSTESSSSSSSSSQLSAAPAKINTVFYSENSAALAEPVISFTRVPKNLQTKETFKIYWTAYSTEGELNDLQLNQISGPGVVCALNNHSLLITTGDAGDVVLEATVTDAQGLSKSTQINFSVKAPFSSKAKLLRGNSSGVGLDLVIVGDAFLAQDQQKLEDAANNFVDYMLSYDNETLASHDYLINVWLVESISASRQVGNGVASGSTLFGSFFNCGGIQRLLCADGSAAVNFVADIVPQFDQILILVNSTTYGGAGGGNAATASLHPASNNVALHELGHSIARLADEYEDDGIQTSFIEPDAVNVTLNSNPRAVKWNYWYEDPLSILGLDRVYLEGFSSANEIGYFQGAYYRRSGAWRPTYSSIMRNLDSPFGAVNIEQWILSLMTFSQNKDNFFPIEDSVTHTDLSTIFSVALPSDDANLQVTWFVNSNPVSGTKAASAFLLINKLDASITSVRVVVEDTTPMIRRDLQNLRKFEHSWTIK